MNVKWPLLAVSGRSKSPDFTHPNVRFREKQPVEHYLIGSACTVGCELLQLTNTWSGYSDPVRQFDINQPVPREGGPEPIHDSHV